MKHPETKCPECKKKLTAASACDGSEVSIAPGDYTICMYCTAYLEYTKKGYKHLHEDEIEPEFINQLKKYRHLLIKFKTLN